MLSTVSSSSQITPMLALPQVAAATWRLKLVSSSPLLLSFAWRFQCGRPYVDLLALLAGVKSIALTTM